jgi:amidase
MRTVSSPNCGAFLPDQACQREPTGSGVLDGTRLAVKDLIDVAYAVTGGGNPDWATSHFAAQRDADCVAVLRAAGSRVVGKTITDELAFSLEGENAYYGTPRHPVHPQRLPGGSSSGSAVAVASHEADLALGTDTGGSVRVPASFCGVAAMRPTHGRVSLDGVLPFAPGYDTVGWFARDAGLLHAAGHVLLGSADEQRPPLRLCMAADALALADAPVREALLAWAAGKGITRTRQVFDNDWKSWLDAYAYLQGMQIQRALGPWIRQQRPRFGAAIAPRFEHALALDPAIEDRWQAWRIRHARQLITQLGPDEAWLVPAAPCVALHRQSSASQRDDFYARALALGGIASHAGLPQVVVPLASVDSLPVGISFIAAPGQDERLLDLALAFSSTGSSA